MQNNILSFEWSSVLTETSLVVFAAMTLLMSAVFSKGSDKWVTLFAKFAVAISLCIEVFCRDLSVSSFGGMLGDSSNFGAIALACALLTSLMGSSYFAKGAKNSSEFYAILMICTAALILFSRSANLMLTFVSLECATICLYAMTCWNKDEASSLESSTKYLIISGVNGAMLLMGIAFIYGASLALGVDLLNFNNFTAGLVSPMFITGLVLIIGAGFFKISAFPFQFWSPDVYQGAPTPSSAFLAVVSKAAGVMFLYKICSSLDFESAGLLELQEKAIFAMSVIAALTIIIGNMGGITQQNVKRLMAFSGISNAGYMMVLLTAVLKFSGANGSLEGDLVFYITAYMFANYAIFFVINSFKGYDDYDQTMADYRGIMKKNPVMGGALIINLASLAGIPPTAGFFGKLLVLLAAYSAGLYWLMGVMIVGSVISIYYYFAWIRAVVDSAEGDERQLSYNSTLMPALVSISVVTLVLGLLIFKI